MLVKEIKYSYRDVSLVPGKLSKIKSRSECNPFYNDGMLPIFTAPMTSVVGEENYQEFLDSGIIPILPRTVNLDVRLERSKFHGWSAYSLEEFRVNFLEGLAEGYALIDIANGHMKLLYDIVRVAKKKKGEALTVMIGNIANPETYHEVFSCGADYVRLGIGSGNGCITSSNTSVHYPMASLISETAEIAREIRRTHLNISVPKIVADGGIRNYSDVIKALALGADYVMIGSLFAQTLESAGVKEYNLFSKAGSKHFFRREWFSGLTYSWDTGIWRGTYIGPGKDLFAGEEIEIEDLQVRFYGMASKDGQIALSGCKTKTSEGITKHLPVIYTLSGWTKNMIDYLRSAMSYTGHMSLSNFIGNCQVIVQSPATWDSVNK